MTRSMDLEFTHGQTKDSIKEYGLRVNSMLLGCIMFQVVKESLDSGKMAKE